MTNGIFGIHDQALKLYELRANLLANNVANADTPGYQARDIDFKSILNNLGNDMDLSKVSMQQTTNHHIPNGNAGGSLDAEILYRTPLQNAHDGNTVEPDVENAAFMDNSIRYSATLNFLNGTIRALTTAIKGE